MEATDSINAKIDWSIHLSLSLHIHSNTPQRKPFACFRQKMRASGVETMAVSYRGR